MSKTSVRSCVKKIVRMISLKHQSIRGLDQFIYQIRNCKSSEEQEMAINEELSKVRSMLKEKTLSGYNKKKCVCKMLYICLLGKNIEFGYLEALSLLSSNIYSEKQIGYIFICLLLNTKDDIDTMVIQYLKFDLKSGKELYMNLALQCISNISNHNMAIEFMPMVISILNNLSCRDHLKQSAILCVLRLYRLNKNCEFPPNWFDTVVGWLASRDLGVVQAATALIYELSKWNSDFSSNGLLRIVVTELWRVLTSSRPGLKEYTYRKIPAPWLQVNYLRIINNIGIPSEQSVSNLLDDSLSLILNQTEERQLLKVTHKHLHCAYAKYAIFFEAVTTITNCTNKSYLQSRACDLAGVFLTQSSLNLQYLALDALSKLSILEACRNVINKYTANAIVLLESNLDISIKTKSIIFLQSNCDASNAQTIVQDLMYYYNNVDYTLKETIAHCVATIAEKYSLNDIWYVDILLKLLSEAGDVLGNKMFIKITEILHVNEEVRLPAVESVLHLLQIDGRSEMLVKTAAVIFSNFGYLLGLTSTILQFMLLNKYYSGINSNTKAILLSSFMRFACRCRELQPLTYVIFCSAAKSENLDIQQRAIEYKTLLETGSDQQFAAVFCENPFNDSLNMTVGRGIEDQRTVDHSQVELNEMNKNVVFGAKNIHSFIKNGILLNGTSILIKIESEYVGAVGTFKLIYKNKLLSTLQLSTTTVYNGDEFSFELPTLSTVLEAGLETCQIMRVICHKPFDKPPKLRVTLKFNENTNIIVIDLPIYLYNFVMPTPLTKPDFFELWTLFSTSLRSDQIPFKFEHSSNIDLIKLKLNILNFKVLDSINCNSNVFVCAGTFSTTSASLLCLFWIELDLSIHLFRVTVGSSDLSIGNKMINLLREIL